jgi:hypothetical protein
MFFNQQHSKIDDFNKINDDQSLDIKGKKYFKGKNSALQI